MSFAPYTGKQDQQLTEKELIHQLASSYAKKNMQYMTIPATEGSPQPKQNSGRYVDNVMAKTKFNAFYHNIGKVWGAFCKYIKSQVEDKDKAVDTCMVGLFIKEKIGESLMT